MPSIHFQKVLDCALELALEVYLNYYFVANCFGKQNSDCKNAYLYILYSTGMQKKKKVLKSDGIFDYNCF